MTLPVCPACRAYITLDTHVCGRCGLAVRPTCGNCGEPLSVDMRFCSRCGVSLDAGYPPTPLVGDTAPIPVPGSAVAVAPVEAPHYTEPQQYYAEPRYYAEPPRRRRGFLRFFVIALVSGVLVAGALVGLELYTPGFDRTPPEQIALSRHDFTGYSVGVPDGWRIRDATIGGRPANTFVDPKRTPDDHRQRGFSITSDNRPIGAVAEVVSKEASSAANVKYTSGLSVGGRDAIRIAVRSDDMQFDRWWVENGTTTLRLEFYSTFALEEETSVLEDRIIDSFQFQ